MFNSSPPYRVVQRRIVGGVPIVRIVYFDDRAKGAAVYRTLGMNTAPRSASVGGSDACPFIIRISMSKLSMLHSNPLGAKLSPPALGIAQVQRLVLLEAMESNPSARLVLVRAPAGFGKTTAMQQYRKRLEQKHVRTAWVTLDQADNDISRFLHVLAAALHDIVPQPTTSDLDFGALLELVARLGPDAGSFVLFLDEYELIREQGVLSLVREIIDNLPRSGQVVIGSRTVPNLGLSRLRARGQLVEVDSEHLRFSLPETEEYLKVRRGIDLVTTDVEKLHRKTEGWIAGLWLASAALVRRESRSEFVSRFSGSSVEVAEYLGEDVLNHQPPEVRRFLLQTSVLRSLDPDLCQALLPDVESTELLRKLESENVLITRIAGETRSYRYHSLFRGFLRAHLEREHSEQVRRLNRAASSWYQAQQRPVPAIDHAIDASDFETAVSLLLAHAPTLLQSGRMRLLTRWFDALPASALVSHPRLQMIQAWSVCFTRGPRDAMRCLREAELNASSDPAVRPHLLAIEPVLLYLMDRADEAYVLATACEPYMPSGDRFADATLLSVLADVCSAKDRTAAAQRTLDMLRSMEGGKVGAVNDMHSQAAEGTLALFEGRMREATARFRIAVRGPRASDVGFTNGNAWAGIPYAAAIYEGNDLAQATALLRVYLPLAREVGLPDHVIAGFRMLARITFCAGEVDDTFRLLAELESIGHERELPRVVASARLERSRIQLFQGHHQAARDEWARASDRAVWAPFASLRLPANDTDYPEVTRLRWEVLAGDARAAASGLKDELQAAAATRRLHRALKLRLLMGLALWRSGQHASAIACTEEVLAECRQEGFVRLILDEGPAMGLLVQQVFDRLRAAISCASDGATLTWLQRLLHAFGPLPARSAAEVPARPLDAYLADPLTPMELKLLKLLSEGYSNKAIAEKLQISDSTVRTHLRSINNKLGVQSRLQAVCAGRAFGLLA